MRKLYIFGLIAVALLVIGIAIADEIKFSTYYPAPFGKYREFDTTGKTCLATDEWGIEGDNACVGIGTTDPGTAKLAVIGGNVGIGTTSPGALLDLDGDGDTIIVPRKSTTGNPAGGQDGMIYYNDADGQFRAHQNGSWGPLGGGISFGNRLVLATVSTTVNKGVTNIDVAATRAVTAGEFICVARWTGADSDQCARVEGYSDSAAIPTTILGYATLDFSYNNIRWASYSFIVNKDDYYMAKWVGVNGNNAPVTRTYYWLPIGN